jgi:hypothetical protein
VFDHLAEYLLKQPVASPAPQPAAQDPEPLAHRPEPPAQRAEPEQSSGAGGTGEGEMRAQDFLFVETAEKLVVEKEAFVREEVVLSKLIETQVADIRDSVRRTEVEVERITPEEAERITPQKAERISNQTPPPAIDLRPTVSRPRLPDAKPAAAPGEKARETGQAPRQAAHSAAWWAWFALILCAGLLVAFSAGQFIGSSGG